MNGSRLNKHIEDFINSLPEVDEENHIYVWGTGNTAALYQEGFKREKEFIIYGYADNDSGKWGTIYEGKEVFSPEQVKEDKKALALICSPQPVVVEKVGYQLDKMGIRYNHIDAVIWGMHKSEIRTVFRWLYDDLSRQVLLEVMKSRVNGKYPDEGIVSQNPYAPRTEFCELNKDEVIVDCGAFVGDTTERFIWQRYGVFKKIIMIEPDRRNLEAIKHRLNRLKSEWGITDEGFTIYPYAVSDKSEKAFVSNIRDGSSLGSRLKIENGIADTDDSVTVACIDDIINEPITYLKADIESFEYRLLKGSEMTIRQYKPKLGICIYHNAVDFYSIPFLIKELNPEYKLIIRHYTMQLFDTILYAW